MRDYVTGSAPRSKFRPVRRNTMAFPRALRETFPELRHDRLLELDSIEGHAVNLILSGRQVQQRFS